LRASVPPTGRRFAAAALVSAAALLVAGCGGGGRDGTGTAPEPPDRLTVTFAAADGGAFRVTLDCAVADRDACAEVLEAVGDARDAERCSPIDDRGRRITITGTIGGQRVLVRVERRTDCEARLYDRVSAALEP
jgi:hypothetical protein